MVTKVCITEERPRNRPDLLKPAEVTFAEFTAATVDSDSRGSPEANAGRSLRHNLAMFPADPGTLALDDAFPPGASATRFTPAPMPKRTWLRPIWFAGLDLIRVAGMGVRPNFPQPPLRGAKTVFRQVDALTNAAQDARQ